MEFDGLGKHRGQRLFIRRQDCVLEMLKVGQMERERYFEVESKGLEPKRA